ncbi:MAG: DUF3465 domain-containing protein [Vulcanimicrobiaceae bacterium]|jgi:hypothetical protein
MPAKPIAPAFALAASLAGCSPAGNDDSNAAVYDAWRQQRSHLEVTASGSVASVLGIRPGPSGNHEGFLLHLRGAGGHGLTVRVEDNIDLTGPISIAPGDDVEVRGEYIYDSNGGLIHYTHRDPSGRHAGGYVKAEGRTFL